MNREDLIFLIEFPTCNSLRQILDFLNQSHKTIPLWLSRDKISIIKANDSETIIFDGLIHPYNMLDYYVDEKYISESGMYYIHIPIAPLLTSLKKIQKKQKVRLLQTKDRENYVTIFGEVPIHILLDPSKEEPKPIDAGENPRPTHCPNMTIQLYNFQYSAASCGRTSDRVSTLRVFQNGVYIYSSSSQGDAPIRKGNCEGEPLCEVHIPGDIMKSISKLASLCDEGIVRIYCSDETHIRLEIPISVIGTCYIYLVPEN